MGRRLGCALAHLHSAALAAFRRIPLGLDRQ